MILRLQCEHQLPFCNMTAFAIHGCHLIGPCKIIEFYCTKYVEFCIFLHILTFPRNPTLALESWRDIGDEYKPFEAFIAKVGQEDSIHPSSEPSSKQWALCSPNETFWDHHTHAPLSILILSDVQSPNQDDLFKEAFLFQSVSSVLTSLPQSYWYVVVCGLVISYSIQIGSVAQPIYKLLEGRTVSLFFSLPHRA